MDLNPDLITNLVGENMRCFVMALGIVVLGSGCATVKQPRFEVKVDSLAASTAQEHKTYVLLPGNDGVTWDDLQFHRLRGGCGFADR